jgi:disulfide bond formation protein DsbB
MIALYVRIALVIIGLIGAAILFAFAFSIAAAVVLVLLLVGLVLGRGPKGEMWVWTRSSTSPSRGPVTIEHDPNDLPPKP